MEKTNALTAPTLFRNNLSAIALGVTGWSLFSFTDTLSKWLAQDYGVSQIICLTSFVSLVLATFWILRCHGAGGFRSPFFKWHILRGLTVAGTSFMVVHAVSRLPLADFYGIIFLTPLIVSLLSHLLLKETVGWHRIMAIIAGFAGVIILAGPQFQTYNAGLFFAFGATFFICCNSLIVRKMQAEKVMLLFAFFPSLFNILLNFPLMLSEFQMPDLKGLLLFLITGSFLVLALVFFSLGFARATETAIIAPFHYIQMLWGVLLGYVLFGDLPTLSTLTGSLIVIGSGIYIIWREHQLDAKSRIIQEPER